MANEERSQSDVLEDEEICAVLRPNVEVMRDALNACEFGGDEPGDDAWHLLAELARRGYEVKEFNR